MRLIVHMGAGKTGTSSIQRTLKENEDRLKAQGVWYLGTMLQLSTVKLYDWQNGSMLTKAEFNSLNQDEIEKQLYEVLRRIIIDAKDNYIHTLIWSNESLMGIKKGIANVLLRLKKENVDIEILYYVREYSSWARSAYIQWGLKSKTYKGGIKSFKEFGRSQKVEFYKKIEYLLDLLPDAVKVRNMSAVDDVVLDFMEYSGVDSEGLTTYYKNEKPTDEELLMRTIFNSGFKGKATQKYFYEVNGEDIPYSQTPNEFLDDLMPDDEALQQVLDESREDRSSLNALLAMQGQPTIEEQAIKSKKSKIDTDKLVVALTSIVMKQSQKIKRLEDVLDELSDSQQKI